MAERGRYPSPDSPVLVIGAAGIDLVGRLASGLTPRTSTPSRIRTSYGGVARNVAENLARLGQPVLLLSVVGEDVAGDQVVRYTQEAGVDTSHVLRSAGHRTGTYLAVVDQSGLLQFALDDMEAASALTTAYLRQHADLFKKASAMFVDANVPPQALRTAFHLARLANLDIFADPTSTTLAGRLTPFLDRINVMTPNIHEAAVLCGREFDPANPEDALHAARHLVSQGVEFAIITLAEFGVTYATSQTRGHIAALRTEITDPTGAGDALTAAVIFARLHEMLPDDAARLGISAASLTLRYAGTVVPDLSLEKLYDELVV